MGWGHGIQGNQGACMPGIDRPFTSAGRNSARPEGQVLRDGVVLLIFATFFTALVVATINSDGRLCTSVRRPRLFQFAVIGAAAVTVPFDLYAVIYATADRVRLRWRPSPAACCYSTSPRP